MNTKFLHLHYHPGNEPVHINPAGIAAFYGAPDGMCYIDLIGHSDDGTFRVKESYDTVKQLIEEATKP